MGSTQSHGMDSRQVVPSWVAVSDRFGPIPAAGSSDLRFRCEMVETGHDQCIINALKSFVERFEL